MKKILTVLFLIICLCSIDDVYAADIGYVRFNVDMSESGCSSDAKVIVEGVSFDNGVVSYSFKLSEYGNQWSYFFDAGSYRVTISDSQKDEWHYEYDENPFIITGNEENGYTFNIKITRPDGYIAKNEDDYEEPHYKDIDNTEETKKENEKSITENKDDSATDDSSHSVFIEAAFIIGGILLLVGVVYLMFKLRNRKR